jgi:hypothetical protein
MAEEENKGVPPKATPNAPRPITVKLKPVAPKSEASTDDKQKAPLQGQPAPQATSVPTARVPIPALDDIDDKDKGKGADDIQNAATVKLRPVKPVREAHKPGSNPLPPGPKPPSDAQVQAAKSKTSRISLDAAIGVAPEGPMAGGGAPKTIRLKRPDSVAGSGKMPTSAVTGAIASQKVKTRTAPIGKTSRIPDEAIPGTQDSATVTQKKTLKIKKKGGSESDAGAEGKADFDGVELTPIADLGLADESGESPVLTAIAGVCAIAAVVVGVLLVICLAAHAVGPAAGKNNLASLKLGSTELPWPGRIGR